jgi:phosphoglycolate phosphatase-like HAD superfamily hydrolase
VSLRRHADRLTWQLERLALAGRFARVVSGAGDGDPEAKVRLLAAAGMGDLRGAVVVGDTGVDVASGKALGALTVALGCGLRSPARLAACGPDLLLDDLGQVAARLAAGGEWTT